MSNLQRLIREVTHLSSSNSNFSLLLRIDHFGSFGEGINIFLKENRYTGEIYSDREVFLDKLQTTFFSSYLLEMYVVYANGNKELYIDTLYWMTKQLNFDPKLHKPMQKIFNYYNNFHPKENGLLSSIATILLPITYEQMDIQDKYESHFNRFYAIYGSNAEVNELYRNKYNLTLKRYLAISWALFAYVGKRKTEFTKAEFCNFMSSTSVTKDEIYSFLNLVSLTRKEFQEKYIVFRKKVPNDSLLDWSDREAVDKALPRVSYFFPLLRNEEHYSLISFTAIKEFLKFKGLYRSMTEGLRDVHFKQRFSGPLFERYVRELASKYDSQHSLNAKIYGDDTYYISKGKEKREPDTIIETDEYMVFIECKTSPFSLNLIKYLDKKYLKNLQESIEKSVINIDTFLQYRAKDKIGKKIAKIIVFSEGIHMAFTMLKSDIQGVSDLKEIFVMDIESLELLLSEYTKPIPEILDDFKAAEKIDSINLNGYIRSTLKNQFIVEEDNEILHHIVKEELGLIIDEN